MGVLRYNLKIKGEKQIYLEPEKDQLHISKTAKLVFWLFDNNFT